MKHCNKCGEDDQGAFTPSLNTMCSRCEAVRVRAWSKANPRKEAARKSAWSKANPEKSAAYSKAWREKNAGAVCAASAKRRAAKLQRTPVWSETENIKGVYLEAQRQQMQVDHIIPLQGELVSGLHVWGNLQLLTPKDNLSKGNKFDVEKFNSRRD